MKTRILTWLGTTALVFGALSSGCGNSSTRSTTAPGGGTTASGSNAKALTVGMVFDSGGRGDKSFNDSAYAGLQKAEKDLGIKTKTVDSKAEKDYEGNLTALADQGVDLIFAVGLTQGKALQTVAPKYPNLKFAIIDGQVDAANVRSIQFREEQGSFLVGYLAGLMTKTGSIGFVGGMNIDLIHKFEAGYIAGAKTANPKVNVLPSKYTGNWDDVQLGKSAAEVLFNQGADIVYHAAGRCGQGVIEAAKEAGKFAIGVDSDQDYVAPGRVLCSMVKHVDVGVYQTIKDTQANAFQAGTKVYDLNSGGVGVSDLTYTKDVIGAANMKKLDDIKQQIIDGKIKPPTDDQELQSYLASLKSTG